MTTQDARSTSTFSTQAVHAGEERRKPHRSLTTPIVQTSTYVFEDTAEIQAFMQHKAAGEPKEREEYGRYGNPTQSAAERKIAALEGGERALLFASGMNAITSTLLTLLSSGDHLVLVDGCYRRTRQFACEFLARWGVETTIVPINDAALSTLQEAPFRNATDARSTSTVRSKARRSAGVPSTDARSMSAPMARALAEAIRPTTRVIFAETPTNPYLRVVDFARMVESARQHGVITIVDSTFATPINLRPLEHGLDLVIHSATKYLGGHNDLLAGAVVGSSEILDKIEETRGVLGGVISPDAAYLLLRGLKTLALRVRRQNENGLRVAQFLEKHPAVRRVYYPGLPSHPDHEISRRQMTGFGGVVSFEIDGDLEKTGRFIDHLCLPYIGPTLGGVESIAQQQAIFISLDPEERRASGIEDSLVRYAVGIEDAEDLIADLDQALAGMQPDEAG